MADPLLDQLGSELRSRRLSSGWTQRQLARESGLSQRFIGQVERGRGNVSIGSLSQLARALVCTTTELLRPAPSDQQASAIELVQRLPQGELPRVIEFLRQCGAVRPDGRRVALVGLRGSGKSTVGRALSERSGARFVELDERIEELAGLPLHEIFDFHGAAHYRELERQALDSLTEETEPLVLATGGSVVTDPLNWETLRRRFVTCWLKTAAEDHFERVRRQGDLRPMAGDPRAMDKLRAILREREPLYALAHHSLDTSELGLEATQRELETLAWPVLVG